MPVIQKKEIDGAIARGWGYVKNVKKDFDPDLAEAIAYEIMALIIPYGLYVEGEIKD